MRGDHDIKASGKFPFPLLFPSFAFSVRDPTIPRARSGLLFPPVRRSIPRFYDFQNQMRVPREFGLNKIYRR